MTRFTGAALAPIGSQFALARPVLDPQPAERAAGPEPFGLRFFRPTEKLGEPPRFRYDHARQVAVTDDDAAVPLIDLDGAPEKTTTGTSDGKVPRGEEFRIDFVTDHR